MGLKDDLAGVNSHTKFLIQFIICTILVVLGNIRITNMHGVFGLYELPYLLSAGISILIILMVVNAFNLIDGIDGLAATTGIVVNGTFAALFIYLRQYELAAVSLSMVGAVAGFLRFNITPAKIFMGDTGSLLIGLISAVLALKFMEVNKSPNGTTSELFPVPALTFAILIGPIFDTVRVFIIRITNGVSPFKADRNHVHHRMLRLGFNHFQTTIILTSINIASILMVLLFKNYGNSTLIILITLVSLVFNWMITFFLRSKKRESLALRNLFV
jgi:UDP-N-acetylmuramyl pentapeptide phosphotransferase/UDP-N-acetylglucosamine-1-phosphate transferase